MPENVPFKERVRSGFIRRAAERLRQNLAELLLEVHSLAEDRHLPFRHYCVTLGSAPDRDNPTLIGCWTCRVIFYESSSQRDDLPNVVLERFRLESGSQNGL